MPQALSTYIHKSSTGNRSQCQGEYEIAQEKLTKLYYAEQIDGFRLLFIIDEEDIAEHNIKCNYDKISEGKFPFVFAFVQPEPGEQFELDGYMSEQGFERCEAN